MKKYILMPVLAALSLSGSVIQAQDFDNNPVVNVSNSKENLNFTIGARFMMDGAYYHSDFTPVKSGAAITDARIRTSMSYEDWYFYAEFATLIADPEIQRLDVRTVAEYSEEHIPGSININVLDEQFAVVADSTLRKDAPVALYCRSGKRSKKAAAILSKKGYTVYELDKGFTGWKQAGKETEK